MLGFFLCQKKTKLTDQGKLNVKINKCNSLERTERN